MGLQGDDYNCVCVVSVDGDFTGDAAAHLHRVVEERIEKRQIVDFVIDMQKSGFVDSAGLEAFLWLKRRCEEVFGQVKLAHLDENCRKILEITRLESCFECHADLPSALKTMR